MGTRHCKPYTANPSRGVCYAPSAEIPTQRQAPMKRPDAATGAEKGGGAGGAQPTPPQAPRGGRRPPPPLKAASPKTKYRILQSGARKFVTVQKTQTLALRVMCKLRRQHLKSFSSCTSSLQDLLHLRLRAQAWAAAPRHGLQKQHTCASNRITQT